MEIVTLPTGTPGTNSGVKKHVEEWSRLDHLTGMLETARVEADHWANNTSNSKHRFGKVVDSRARNLADGSVQQQQQTKQLEVYQAHIPGGSVQVIRSHTSTTSSWHNSKVLQSKSHSDWSSSFANKQHRNIMESSPDSLKLQHNVIDLKTEKTKADVARLLPPRRPPTRTKPSVGPNSDEDYFSMLPELCHEVHSMTEKHLNAITQNIEKLKVQCSMTNGDAGDHSSTHLKLEKKKSISDEYLNVVDEKENSNPWKWDSKSRRSLRLPRSKYRDSKLEVENKSKLEKALEKVIKRNGEAIETQRPPVETIVHTTPATGKRKSFVTEETLKETRQKLRHLNTHECKIVIPRDDIEENDDGICTESKGNSDREEDEPLLYIKGKETLDTSTGTGSLECRGKNKSDVWSDRRKSYGFEPVYGQHNNLTTMDTPKSNLSTDSGICRSSELELASTPIMKKLTEVNEELARKSTTLIVSNEKSNGISALLSRFEKKSDVGATVVTLNEEKNKPDSDKSTIRSGKVAEVIKALNGTASETKFIKNSALLIGRCSSVENVNEELISKRHSIACDDTKHIGNLPALPKASADSNSAENGNSTVVNVNSYEKADVPHNSMMASAGDAADVKKPKKVEFSKTEVHFAATEPGKIKIVETNEKPPPANLHRRRRRSLSTSPKVGLPQIKFGDDCSRGEARNETAVEIANESNERGESCGGQFTSSVSDNGLAVRISSTKPTDARRASWSVSDTNENKSGYSTKINFGGEGVTVVADVKSHLKHEGSAAASPVCKDLFNDLDVDANIGKNGTNFREKLVVRIGSGGCGADTATTDKYVRKNCFSNCFRNSSICYRSPLLTTSSSSFSSITPGTDDKLKSTSLIIDTIKRSINAKTSTSNAHQQQKHEALMENKISNLRRSEKATLNTVEQPSTYITEMNKLQHKYRVQQNKSVDKLPLKDDRLRTRLYNTVPGTKNGPAWTKMMTNDLPSVLSAFDTLYQSIDRAIDENRIRSTSHQQVKSNTVVQTRTVAEKCITQQRSSQFKKYSSQSWFLEQIVAKEEDDCNLSDDSLKADEEVRSYMSTAIMEEYENELSGSWSRRRYIKHVKPNNVAKEDEISEKSHFKPLRNDEEKLKTVTNFTNVDIKRPKITSVAVNLTPYAASTNFNDGGNVNLKKCTTVLLNNTNDNPKYEPMETTTSTTRERNTRPTKDTSVSIENSCRITTPVRTISKHDSKHEYKSVKVIHHDDAQVLENQPLGTAKSKEFPRVKSRPHNSTSDNSSVSNGSVRKKPVLTREKLFDSGRDSWLNLPKKGQKTSSDQKIYTDCIKVRPTQSRRVAAETNSAKPALESLSNGYADASCESTHRSKHFTKPMTTIAEKERLDLNGKVERSAHKLPSSARNTRVVRTTSNSSLESHSSSFEFHTPVLKTEERSRRRAARMMQRTDANREALMNSKSSSEDIASENEVGCLRSSKVKSPRKTKIPKTRAEQAALLAKPNVNRLVQQKSAKMQINIFNIKEKPGHDRKTAIQSCPSRAYYNGTQHHHSSATGSKTRCQPSGQRETDLRLSQMPKTSHRTLTNGNKEARVPSSSAKVARSAAK